MNNEDAFITSAAAKTNTEVYQLAVDMPLPTSEQLPSGASGFGTQPDTPHRTMFPFDEAEMSDEVQKRKLDESDEGDEGMRKRMCNSNVTNHAIGDVESHRAFPVTTLAGISNSTVENSTVEIFGRGFSKDPTSAYNDLGRNSNTTVSDGKKGFCELDPDQQMIKMERRLKYKRESRYHKLSGTRRDQHIRDHINQAMTWGNPRIEPSPPASLTPMSASACGPSTSHQAITPRSKSPGSPRPSSCQLQAARVQAAQLHYNALRSGYLSTDALVSLVKLPERRPLNFRPLTNRHLLNLATRFNLEAAVAYTAGNLAQTPCTKCTTGYGLFPECIQAEGFLGGSCANCHYNGQGSRCSLRPAIPMLPQKVRLGGKEAKDTATVNSNGGSETTKTTRQSVNEQQALGARQEPSQNADPLSAMLGEISSSIVVDTSGRGRPLRTPAHGNLRRSNNTSVSDGFLRSMSRKDMPPESGARKSLVVKLTLPSLIKNPPVPSKSAAANKPNPATCMSLDDGITYRQHFYGSFSGFFVSLDRNLMPIKGTNYVQQYVLVPAEDPQPRLREGQGDDFKVAQKGLFEGYPVRPTGKVIQLDCDDQILYTKFTVRIPLNGQSDTA